MRLVANGSLKLYFVDSFNIDWRERVDKQKLLSSARSFGAEARANQRSSFMAGDDRKDLAHTAGVLKWSDLPEELRDELQAAWNVGFEAESKTYFS